MNEPPSLNDLLVDFPGPSLYERVGKAIEHIAWLRMELKISKYNESAALTVDAQNQAETAAMRRRLRRARECMEANDPLNARDIFGPAIQGEGHEQTARKTDGASSQVKERTGQG